MPFSQQIAKPLGLPDVYIETEAHGEQVVMKVNVDGKKWMDEDREIYKKGEHGGWAKYLKVRMCACLIT